MAPTSENNADQIQWDALRHQASRFTFCLIDKTEQTIGTVIAINLEQKFFFVSAKHLIDNDHELEILPKGHLTPATSLDFIEKICDGQFDVGFIELNSDAANRFDFAEDTRLSVEIDGEKELPTLVIGYPSQFIQSADTQITDNMILRLTIPSQLVFRSVVLPQSEWPNNSSLKESLNPLKDLLIDYKPEQRIKQLLPGASVVDAPFVDCKELDPHGMSGGGIWLAKVEERYEGLCLSDVRLIGIQTGWYKDFGLLKGLRISLWLDMFRTTYPKLMEG
jgi:hypothetical protein